ncbi:hypothetical protein CFELI_10220 [Corynebacterium felinum]|uniref:Transposase n=1 Tax=Corynebacterium felinum TaxID=131318 RepID=A0ABU2BEY9_9CORY|nr:hypothetical protein [Corynebacterium felinum]WJY95642.1 hypothetical protein CFELI_10220 [Corynebacterium felinum]
MSLGVFCDLLDRLMDAIHGVPELTHHTFKEIVTHYG